MTTALPLFRPWRMISSGGGVRGRPQVVGRCLGIVNDDNDIARHRGNQQLGSRCVDYRDYVRYEPNEVDVCCDLVRYDSDVAEGAGELYLSRCLVSD